MQKTITTLLAGVALVFCSSVQAAALCSASSVHPDGLARSDVSFNGTNASDCSGVFTGTATASNLGFDGFSSVAGVQPGGTSTGSFGGVDFTLGSLGLIDFGTWSLAWTGVNGPITIDLVAVVQTATTFASYFFDDLVLSASPGSGTGAWAVNYLVNEAVAPIMSFSLFARDFRGPDGGGGTAPPPTGEVGEPATAALLGLALLGLGFARRSPARR